MYLRTVLKGLQVLDNGSALFIVQLVAPGLATVPVALQRCIVNTFALVAPCLCLAVFQGFVAQAYRYRVVLRA